MVVLVVMGVCGCGKSTVGRALAQKLGIELCDADTVHPPANVLKMTQGIPLTDQDRRPWLLQLHNKLVTWVGEGDGVKGVMACSALKQHYRDILCGSHQHGTDLTNQIKFIYLRGTREVILERLQSRSDHFMPSSLLDSQLSDLEEPVCNTVSVDITQCVEDIVDSVLLALDLR